MAVKIILNVITQEKKIFQKKKRNRNILTVFSNINKKLLMLSLGSESWLPEKNMRSLFRNGIFDEVATMIKTRDRYTI